MTRPSPAPRAALVLDVEDAVNGDLWAVYRCDECKALLLKEDAREHLRWHGAVMANPT